MFKGIPYMALKFEEVLTNFKTISFEQNQFFREELKKISDTFITQIQTSNNWHEWHSKKLENQSKQLEEILTRITK